MFFASSFFFMMVRVSMQLALVCVLFSLFYVFYDATNVKLLIKQEYCTSVLLNLWLCALV